MNKDLENSPRFQRLQPTSKPTTSSSPEDQNHDSGPFDRDKIDDTFYNTPNSANNTMTNLKKPRLEELNNQEKVW